MGGTNVCDDGVFVCAVHYRFNNLLSRVCAASLPNYVKECVKECVCKSLPRIT